MNSVQGQPSEQNSTFGNQDVLPRLPVPPLEETVCRFLEWTGPLLSEEEREKTAKAAEEFLSPSGAGASGLPHLAGGGPAPRFPPQ